MVLAVLWLRAEGKRDLMLTSFVAITAIASTVRSQIVAYYLRNEDAEKLASFNNRTLVWEITIESFERRPLHGRGLTASRSLFLDDTGLGGAHNAYINVMVDVGLVGLFFWGGLLVLVTVGAWRLRHRVRRTAGADALTFDSVT
ncbi:MAG: O-antigen ligase family protein, partial [Gammaproteobacteria bacterium]|nr:O-antigen ligase family protein [Gammaproteobacteria bacterium]